VLIIWIISFLWNTFYYTWAVLGRPECDFSILGRDSLVSLFGGSFFWLGLKTKLTHFLSFFLFGFEKPTFHIRPKRLSQTAAHLFLIMDPLMGQSTMFGGWRPASASSKQVHWTADQVHWTANHVHWTALFLSLFLSLVLKPRLIASAPRDYLTVTHILIMVDPSGKNSVLSLLILKTQEAILDSRLPTYSGRTAGSAIN